MTRRASPKAKPKPREHEPCVQEAQAAVDRVRYIASRIGNHCFGSSLKLGEIGSRIFLDDRPQAEIDMQWGDLAVSELDGIEAALESLPAAIEAARERVAEVRQVMRQRCHEAGEAAPAVTEGEQ
jgi:hypothetical protein